MKKLPVILLLMLMAASCEKEVIDYMQQYYTESMGLQGVSSDSITKFSDKVNNYVTVYPEEKENPLYPKIQSNIHSALLRITITVDTTWAGTTTIKF